MPGFGSAGSPAPGQWESPGNGRDDRPATAVPPPHAAMRKNRWASAKHQQQGGGPRNGYEQSAPHRPLKPREESDRPAYSRELGPKAAWRTTGSSP